MLNSKWKRNKVNILLIGIGGFLGAVSRYYLGGYVHQLLDKHNFPYGTFAVNVIGCLLIGFLGGFTESKQFISDEARTLLFIGFLGAFTTFSTFGYETMKLIWEQQMLMAGVNVSIHVILGLLAVWLGHLLSKLFS